MKKFLKVFGIILATIILVVAGGFKLFSVSKSNQANKIYEQLGEEAPVLTIQGKTYRDLNKNGTLDIYEDSGAEIENRVKDLLGRMTVEEKAGTMFITMIGMTSEGEPFDVPRVSKNPADMMQALGMPPASEMLVTKKMNSFNILHSYGPDILARFNNNVQKIAERTRLGIPVTIASDPRHGAEDNPGAFIFTPTFSQWPNPLGMAATRDTLLVRDFADMARQEYRSVGIAVALHPMADLATEPRWTRINGTFGEDASLAASMTRAYVLGFQGDTLGTSGVACMTKHFSGGGPQLDGLDAHFSYGKEQVYPGDHFDYHLIPFIDGAFPARTAQIMPYYGIPVGQTGEDVGFAFNREIITGLLRDSLHFDGVVCTDWVLITASRMGEARAWGVEELTPLMRVKKVIDAGCDQFGGEAVPALIVELVESGQGTEERIDESVGRILRDKFRLGLFDNPYVDEAIALKIAGNDRFMERGKEAQARSMVLLKNEGLLPLTKGVKVYAEGMKNLAALEKFGEIVDDPASADVIIKRITTPYDPPRGDSFLERFFHQGRLHYSETELAEITGLMELKPTVVVAHLERPTILTEVSGEARALMADFGTSDEVLVEVLFGVRVPEGRLPFELPSSREAVEKQLEDVPYDSENPLYPFGHGLSYQSAR